MQSWHTSKVLGAGSGHTPNPEITGEDQANWLDGYITGRGILKLRLRVQSAVGYVVSQMPSWLAIASRFRLLQTGRKFSKICYLYRKCQKTLSWFASCLGSVLLRYQLVMNNFGVGIYKEYTAWNSLARICANFRSHIIQIPNGAGKVNERWQEVLAFGQ